MNQSITILIVSAMMSAPCLGNGNLARVPPINELKIYPPKVDSLDQPRPLFIDNQNGTQHIEIPPTVIVHQYYYTGDRSFQGPMLTGGPTILVANHPKTGEQIQLRAQLRPGAPRVHYTRNEIRYEYPDHWTILDFGILSLCEPHIVNRDKPKVVLAGKTVTKKTAQSSVGLVKRTRLPAAVGTIDRMAKNAIAGGAERVGDAGSMIFQPVIQLYQATPISSLLSPSAGNVNPGLNDVSAGGIVEEFQNTFPTNR